MTNASARLYFKSIYISILRAEMNTLLVGSNDVEFMKIESKY